LTSVESTKSKGNQKGPETKVVTKVYDFAGEKVEVQERVKVKAQDSETRSSTSSSISNGGTPGKAGDSNELNSNGVGKSGSSSSSMNGSSSKVPQTGDSSSTPGDLNEIIKIPMPRKTRISFLSGDPADIGLAGDRKVSAREGLANALNALHARNKKMGTLEKAKLDWEQYKKQEGIQEELHGHTKSKHG